MTCPHGPAAFGATASAAFGATPLRPPASRAREKEAAAAARQSDACGDDTGVHHFFRDRGAGEKQSFLAPPRS